MSQRNITYLILDLNKIQFGFVCSKNIQIKFHFLTTYYVAKWFILLKRYSQILINLQSYDTLVLIFNLELKSGQTSQNYPNTFQILQSRIYDYLKYYYLIIKKAI